jgi:phosphoesterase RecJ-like protein
MIARVCKLITSAKNILVTSHTNPDGDAVGCLLGCGRMLQLLNKNFVLYAPDSIPELFRFLALSDTTTARPAADATFDLSLIFDTADPVLLGNEMPPAPRAGVRVVIDHHLRHKPFGDMVWRDATASAAGVLLYRLAAALQIKGDQALAESLWCAIYTDTGGFRYSSTTPEALRISAELLEWGVDPWKMATAMYESNPAARIHLLSRVLSTLDISQDGKVATIVVPQNYLAEFGLDSSMLDTFINYARGIRGVEVAIQIAQRHGGWKCSLRSKGTVDVSDLAERFGGGGHRNAAGCFLKGSLQTVRERILTAAQEVVAQANQTQK